MYACAALIVSSLVVRETCGTLAGSGVGEKGREEAESGLDERTRERRESKKQARREENQPEAGRGVVAVACRGRREGGQYDSQTPAEEPQRRAR